MVKIQEFWKKIIKKSSFQDLNYALVNQFESSKQKFFVEGRRKLSMLKMSSNKLEKLFYFKLSTL